MRLLLIEDEKSAVDYTTRLLGPFASRIDDTPFLAQGLVMAEKNDYDVAILDLQLLDSSRSETPKFIPELKRLAKAPVIVVSGWPDPLLKEQCLAAGADGFVNKNDLKGAILMAIQSALKHAPEKVREPTYREHIDMLERWIQTA